MNPDPDFGSPVDDDDDVVVVDGLDDIPNKFLATKGLHEIRVVGAAKEISKSSGNPMVVLSVCLTGRMMTKKGLQTFDTEVSADSGKEFKTYYSLSKAASFKMLELANAFDLPVVSGQVEIRLSKLVGKMAMAVLVDREWEGNAGSNVNKLLAHPDGPES